MSRRPREMSKDEIEEAADRAEGKKPEKHAGGRPAKYKPEFAAQAEKLCVLGATNEDLADFFEVNIRTVQRWAGTYDEFCRALKTKDTADDRVERSLYQKAVGYTFDSEKVFQHQGEIIRAKTREHIPPDTTAMIFWLKNRRPEHWRDKVDVNLSGKLTRDLSDQELADIASAGRDGVAAATSPSKLAH